MPKAKVKRFDVWVTRHHFGNHQIRVSNAATTTIFRTDGCTLFRHIGSATSFEDLTKGECLKRFNFLPRPGQCVNVWLDSRGNIQYREHPILEKYRGTLYKKVTLKAEAQHYI